MLNPRQRSAYEALGISDERLPQILFDTATVDGVLVWVRTRQPNEHYATHRLMCACPTCGKHLSYARLPQHAHSHNRALWRTVASGLVPCTVLAYDTESGTGIISARIRINRTQGAYRKGEIQHTSASFILPR